MSGISVRNKKNEKGVRWTTMNNFRLSAIFFKVSANWRLDIKKYMDVHARPQLWNEIVCQLFGLSGRPDNNLFRTLSGMLFSGTIWSISLIDSRNVTSYFLTHQHVYYSLKNKVLSTPWPISENRGLLSERGLWRNAMHPQHLLHFSPLIYYTKDFDIFHWK